MGDIFVWSTIILSIWGAVGPLVGVRYGQELAKRNQRAQWILDSKKQEYKELLKAMGEAFATYIHYYCSPSEKEKRDVTTLSEADKKVLLSIDGSLFIRDEVNREKIGERFVELLRAIENGKKNYSEAGVVYGEIRNAVIELSRKSFDS
ncbi:MAG TPA: hypothetical protein VGK24_02925 [Candidatus Angelobacter sp.]|jgi:hypothetical protein